MLIVSWEEFINEYCAEKPMAATVGVFDGLHLGHRRLLEKVSAHVREMRTSAFTFTENPKKTLRPNSWHGDLASLDQKIDGFNSMGIELCVLIDFSGNFCKLSGRDFLSLLKDRGLISYLAIGSDFRCGHRLDTDVDDIRGYYGPLGIETEVLEHVMWNGHTVSSSRIRSAILDGRLENATEMLGRPYEIDLRKSISRTLSINRECYSISPGRVVPPEGVYAAELIGFNFRIPTDIEIRDGMVFVGTLKENRPDSVALIKLTKRLKG